VKIKIHPDNAAKIEAALAAVNGRSYVHAYTSFKEIETLASTAESQLSGRLLKSDRAGVTYRSTSGGRVPASYRYARHATAVEILRGTRAWFLVGVGARTIFREAGNSQIGVTQKHENAHLALMRHFWQVQGSK